MALLIWLSSCETPEVQRPPLTNGDQIQNRDVPDDCEDCPVSDCCCSVEYLSGPSMNVWICGSTTGLSNIDCGPVQTGSCYEIEGYILPFEVESQNPFGFYCMAKNSSFYIQNRNTSGSGTAIRITCQAGQIGAQSDDITLGPGNSAFYTVNGDCEIHECD